MKFIKILVLCLLLVPFNVNAAGKTYISKNLEETLKEEAEVAQNAENPTVFEYDLSSYKETDDQITIYMFRGTGCAYCKRFLTFLNSIVPEYGKYFKLESYEVWYNKDNNQLFKDVADFLDEDAGGVPFIIIGDQVFPGYASQYDESIKKAIVDLYNSDNRYDVFAEMEKAALAANKPQKIDFTTLIIWNGIFIAAATGAMIAYDYNKNKKLNELLTSIEKTLKETKKEVEATDKKEKTKSTKTTKKSDKK